MDKLDSFAACPCGFGTQRRCEKRSIWMGFTVGYSITTRGSSTGYSLCAVCARF